MGQDLSTFPPLGRIFSDSEIRDILLDFRVVREIAMDYGVSTGMIAAIKSFRHSSFRNPELRVIPAVVGVRSVTAKLDELAVEKILADGRPLARVAEDARVSIGTVWRIRNGKYKCRTTHVKTWSQFEWREMKRSGALGRRCKIGMAHGSE